MTEDVEKFKSASVTVNLNVIDVLGSEVETEKEQELFLALISSFFSSEFIFEQLKVFVKMNWPNNNPASKLILPDKEILVV